MWKHKKLQRTGRRTVCFHTQGCRRQIPENSGCYWMGTGHRRWYPDRLGTNQKRRRRPTRLWITNRLMHHLTREGRILPTTTAETMNQWILLQTINLLADTWCHISRCMGAMTDRGMTCTEIITPSPGRRALAHHPTYNGSNPWKDFLVQLEIFSELYLVRER